MDMWHSPYVISRLWLGRPIVEVPVGNAVLMRDVIEQHKDIMDKLNLYAILREAMAKLDVPIVEELLLHGACFPDDRSCAEMLYRFIHFQVLSERGVNKRLDIVRLLLTFEGTQAMMLDAGIHAYHKDLALILLLIENGIDIFATRSQYSNCGSMTYPFLTIHAEALDDMRPCYVKRLEVAQMTHGTLFSWMLHRVDLFAAKKHS